MKKKVISVKKYSPKAKKITVAKGVKVTRGTEEKMRKGKGSGSAGKYKNVARGDFVGSAGGASKFSYPVDTLARARNALARAHFAPNPEGIKRAVYRKYPELKAHAVKRGTYAKKKTK